MFTTPTRLERTTVVTEKGHAVLELLRRQDALPADDVAGRAELERQLTELLASAD